MQADPSSVSMIDLVGAALTPGHVDGPAHLAEIDRRWSAAADRHALARQAFGHPNRARAEAIDATTDLVAVEHARCYLGVLTVISDLWTLQQAGVRPEDLYATPDSPRRVLAVLRRESARGGQDHDEDTDTPSEADPLGEGALHLARWTEMSLFGTRARLHEDQSRLAGNMRTDLLGQITALSAERLARLRGPWSLPELSASPVGKDLHLFHHPEQPEPRPALVWGAPATVIGRHTVQDAVVRTRLAVRRHAAELGDVPMPEQLRPGTRPAHRRRLLGLMRENVEFFIHAAAVVGLAVDDVARVEGRPVPPNQRGHVLALHHDAAASDHIAPVPTTSITVAGLVLTHHRDHGHVLARVDAAGTSKDFAADQLPDVLALLLQPPEATVASLARIHAALSRLAPSDGHPVEEPRRPRSLPPPGPPSRRP